MITDHTTITHIKYAKKAINRGNMEKKMHVCDAYIFVEEKVEDTQNLDYKLDWNVKFTK